MDGNMRPGEHQASPAHESIHPWTHVHGRVSVDYTHLLRWLDVRWNACSDSSHQGILLARYKRGNRYDCNDDPGHRDNNTQLVSP
jgi:hypothetical protein